MAGINPHFIYTNGIDLADYDPLEQFLQEGDAPLPIDNFLHANPALEIHELNPDNIAQAGNQEIPDDQGSIFSSGETLPVGSDEVFDNEENIPLIDLEYGRNGRSSYSSNTPGSSRATDRSGVLQSPVISEHMLPDEVGATGGNINEAYEVHDESELSDFTASGQGSSDARAEGEVPEAGCQGSADARAAIEVPAAGDPELQPENAGSNNIVVQQPVQVSVKPTSEDTAAIFLKLGAMVSLSLIGCVVMIGLSIEGMLGYDFLIIGLLFFFVLLMITVLLFTAACHYADLDREERANPGSGNRRDGTQPVPFWPDS